MTDRIVDFDSVGYPMPPPLGNVAMNKPAVGSHVNQIFTAQDRTLTPGRRVILESSMRGNPRHQVTDVDIAAADEAFPNPEVDFENTVMELEQVPVTQGHILRIEAHGLPSGPTGEDVAGALAYGGDYGEVVLEVVWDDGTVTETVTTTLTFEAQPTAYGHITDVHGMGFSSLQSRWGINHPSGILQDTGDLVDWTQAGLKVDLKLSYIGGARPVDVVVFETPHKLARAEGVPASPAHIYQTFQVPITTYPLEYPCEGAAVGERRFGAAYSLDVAASSQRQIGPSIMRLSSHTGARRNESGDPAPWSVTSTSLAPLGRTSALGGSDEAPSFDFSAATFGRRFASSSGDFALEDTGVCRVLVSAYMKVESGGSMFVRFKAGDYSYVDVTTKSTSYEWVQAVTHLECGQTILDGVQLEILATVTPTYTGSVRYVHVEYLPD